MFIAEIWGIKPERQLFTICPVHTMEPYGSLESCKELCRRMFESPFNSFDVFIIKTEASEVFSVSRY